MGDEGKSSSATQQLAAITAEERVRREYEEKEQARVASELEKLRVVTERLHSRVDKLDSRLIRVEQGFGILKWAAGVIVTSVIGLIVTAIAALL